MRHQFESYNNNHICIIINYIDRMNRNQSWSFNQKVYNI